LKVRKRAIRPTTPKLRVSSSERQRRAFDLIDRATDGVLLWNEELLQAKASASTWTAGVITPTRA
jgi:hypothetical protein